MNCLVCEERITFTDNVPSDAVIVKIPGNYGSSIFDPGCGADGNTTLRAYICDLCLLAKSKQGMVQAITVERAPPTISVRRWTPEP